MTYDIKSKSDLLSGAMLVVSIPESDLDKKALYTIQADMPEFLVPFRSRSIDGQVEFTYLLGDRSMLQYRFGRRTPAEYTEFWLSVLQPLLDCTDWFLKADSFVLDTRYMYLNRDGRTVSYIYIPSKQVMNETYALKQFVNELSQRNTVTDADLENKVLKAIVHDFQLTSFLRMLREAMPNKEMPNKATQTSPAEDGSLKKTSGTMPSVSPLPTDKQVYAPPKEVHIKENKNPELPEVEVPDPEGFVINLEDNRKKGHKEKAEKPPRKGLFGKKNKENKIVLGAAVEPNLETVQPRKKYDYVPESNLAFQENDSVTELLDDGDESAHFRFIGSAPLPQTIPVSIQPGSAFTIGRYDNSVGHQQSDFEFAHDTKAVSRHHAAIERAQDGSYLILDLSSKAGTFVNGTRLVPNIPVALERGCRVSFGNGGADYVWEI